MYLRAIAESSDNGGVLEILGKSTIDSSVLLIKAAVVFGKEMAKIKMTKDPKEKKELYRKALADARGMRQAAYRIPPDGVADHVWRLFTKPWWTTFYKYSKAIESDTASNIAKNETITKFDNVIDFISKELEKLEEEK